MKRFLTLFLTLCLLTLPVLSGCKKEEPENPDTDAPTVFTVAESGKATCSIIYARGTGYRKRMVLADNLAAFIKLQTGVKPDVFSDEEATDTSGCEILIGNTNRAESATALADVSDSCTFAIRVVGNKLAVVAGSDGALSAAIELLTTTPKKLGYKLKDSTMTFPTTLAYTERAIFIGETEHLGYVCKIADMDGHVVVQGGCTDGTYMYVCMENQAGDYEHTSKHTTIICKLELATGQLVAMSAPLKLDHSNDMAYNSTTGELIVVHCGSENGRNKTLSFLDPETLTILRTRDAILPNGAYALAYNATRNQYVTGDGGSASLSVCNAGFAYLDTMSSFATGHITQGIDCDDDYIYSVLTGDGKDGIDDEGFGYLVISTWEGKLVATCRIPLPTGESSEIETECIFHVGNDFYVVYNALDGVNAGHIHKFTIEGLRN